MNQQKKVQTHKQKPRPIDNVVALESFREGRKPFAGDDTAKWNGILRKSESFCGVDKAVINQTIDDGLRAFAEAVNAFVANKGNDIRAYITYDVRIEKKA